MNLDNRRGPMCDSLLTHKTFSVMELMICFNIIWEISKYAFNVFKPTIVTAGNKF